MDQKEDTKNTEKAPELQSKSEPARRCQICGGPNHNGCGCEAKARRETTAKNVLPKIHLDMNGRALCVEAKPGEKNTSIQYEVTCQECIRLMRKAGQPVDAPEPEDVDEISKAIFSNEEFNRARQLSIDQNENIQQIKELIAAQNELIEGVVIQHANSNEILLSINNFFKLLVDDVITIRKILIMDEYKEAKPKDEPETEQN